MYRRLSHVEPPKSGEAGTRQSPVNALVIDIAYLKALSPGIDILLGWFSPRTLMHPRSTPAVSESPSWQKFNESIDGEYSQRREISIADV